MQVSRLRSALRVCGAREGYQALFPHPSTSGRRSSLGPGSGGVPQLVGGGADVSPFAVRESVCELLAGSDSGEDAEDAAEAVGDAERGGESEDDEHCDEI